MAESNPNSFNWKNLFKGISAFRAVHTVIGTATILTLAFFISTQFLIDRLQRSIRYEVDAVIEKDALAYEIEINVIGLGLGVFKYLDTGEKKYLDRVEEDRRELNEFLIQFKKLADTDSERRLLEELRDLYRQYGGLVKTILELHDKINEEKAQVIQCLGLLASHPKSHNIANQIQGFFMARQISDDVFESCDNLIKTLEETLEKEPDFRADVAESASPISQSLTQPLRNFLKDRKQLTDSTAKFIQIRILFDELLDEELQSETSNSVKQTQEKLRAASRDLSFLLPPFSIGLTILWLLIAWFTRKINKGVSDLISDAELVGGGEFKKPVEVSFPRELSQLSRAMDGMRLDLQNTVVSKVALEKSEAKLREMVAEWHLTFNTLSDSILVLSEKGQVIKANLATARLAGMAVEEMEGCEFATLSREQPFRSIGTLCNKVRLSGTLERLRISDDNAGKTWEVQAQPYRQNGRNLDTILLIRDTSSYDAMVKKLEESNHLAQLGIFTANIAHEVRNPLFGLMANLEAWEAEADPSSDYSPFRVRVKREVNRLNDLMRDLLEFGRPTQTEFSRGDLCLTVQQAILRCKMLAKSKNVEVQNKMKGPLICRRMDPQCLEQAFVNLIENALSFAPEGSVVTITQTPKEGSFIEIEISDRGGGFSEEDLAKMAEPFYSKRQGGTGLGLAIVQRTVEDHHGELHFDNRKGGGAVVRVVLPHMEEVDS